MPKMTDYVREGYQKRRRPWESAELPEWWNLMVWVGLAMVGGILVIGMLLADGSSPGVEQVPRKYAVQTLNPYAPTATPSAPETGPATGPAAAPASPGPVPTAFTAADFAATAPASGCRSPAAGPRSCRPVPATRGWPRPRRRHRWLGRESRSPARPSRRRRPGPRAGWWHGQPAIADPSWHGTDT